MPIQLATKTLSAIDSALEADQGAAFRQLQQQTLPHIGDAYRGVEKNPYRNHMGASVIGDDCPRKVWYGWRWFTKPKFGGKTLRLFNRGHLEEGRVIALLLMIGVKVYQQDANGKQYRIFHAGGHFGGSGDGVLIGIPDIPPDIAALLECKTHGDKSFKDLVLNGVAMAKPEHYTQMQVYMRKMGLMYAVYFAVNKNTDEIYIEIIILDTLHADQYLDRGQQLINMFVPPRKLNESPGYYKCKQCDHRPICHLGAEPQRNCRTCYHSRPREDGNWYCTEPTVDAAFGDNPQLSEDDQLRGCDNYLKI